MIDGTEFKEEDPLYLQDMKSRLVYDRHGIRMLFLQGGMSYLTIHTFLCRSKLELRAALVGLWLMLCNMSAIRIATSVEVVVRFALQRA